MEDSNENTIDSYLAQSLASLPDPAITSEGQLLAALALMSTFELMIEKIERTLSKVDLLSLGDIPAGVDHLMVSLAQISLASESVANYPVAMEEGFIDCRTVNDATVVAGDRFLNLAMVMAFVFLSDLDGGSCSWFVEED